VGKDDCALISASDAAIALRMAVGKALSSPGIDLSNGAKGGGCQWSDSAGGVVAVATVIYPSPAIASKVFYKAVLTAPEMGIQPVHLPDMGVPAHGDTGTASGTRVAEAFMLDGARELDVTINTPVPSSGPRFTIKAFVTLVQQATAAWR
jgi:hypothetical protein